MQTPSVSRKPIGQKICQPLPMAYALFLSASVLMASADDATGQSPQKRSGIDHSIPYYLQKRPTWAFQFSGSWTQALGSEARAGNSSLTSSRSGELAIEYQPPWVQALGVLSGGVHVRYHSASAAKRLLGYGGRLAYQAKWFTNQWVVPVAGYSLDQVYYELNSGAQGTLANPGIFYGLRFFLSAADPGAAAELYNSLGVTRTYLSVELFDRQASNADLTLSGRTLAIGLRMEH
ncbi:MAG: hypothetical protein ACK5QT_09430 [Oligoflexia bacterium]